MAIKTHNDSWRDKYYQYREDAACSLHETAQHYESALQAILAIVELKGDPELVDSVREALASYINSCPTKEAVDEGR
jgi:hypothetical protein